MAKKSVQNERAPNEQIHGQGESSLGQPDLVESVLVHGRVDDGIQ